MTLFGILTGESRVPSDRINYEMIINDKLDRTNRRSSRENLDKNYLNEFDMLRDKYIKGFITLSIYNSEVSRLRSKYNY